MTDNIGWIAAAADSGKEKSGRRLPFNFPERAKSATAVGKNLSLPNFPRHQFPSTPNREEENSVPPELARYELLGRIEADRQAALEDDPLDRNPDLRSYRGRTVTLLRRYMRYSLETGRLPSVLGSEFFRTQVTSYSVVTFEDRVVFAHDMETSLLKLGDFPQQVIAKCILQEHNIWDVARMLRCNEKTIRRMVPIALDQLSEILLELGIMDSLDFDQQKSCQVAKNGKFPVSDW